MTQELSKKGWVIGFLGFGILAFSIAGQYAKATAQTNPKSCKSRDFYQNNLSFPF